MRKIIQPCGFHCIKINNLGVSFGEQTVLEDVNMHIHCGSFNVIIGQNGAGKSTLIKAILGEIPHTCLSMSSSASNTSSVSFIFASIFLLFGKKTGKLY